MLLTTRYLSQRDNDLDKMWARIDPWVQRRYEIELEKEKRKGS